MRLLCWIRGSYDALQLLYLLSRIINLFCRHFDPEGNRAVRSRAELPSGLLNGQDTPGLSELPYGAWLMGRNGCEVIAAYNALQTLGAGKPLPEVAEALERRGLLFNGFGGTNLGAVASYLRRNGISVRIRRRRDAAQYDRGIQESTCGILSYWTGKPLRSPDGHWNTIHTVSVHRRGAELYLCNVFTGSNKPLPIRSLSDFLAAQEAAPICLFLLDREIG